MIKSGEHVLDLPPVTLHPALRRILDDATRPSRKLLYCAACGAPITNEEARISAAGSHEHHFSNPFGIQFHVGCYSHAPGCSVLGPAQHADSWFPQHLWRIAVCGACNSHLGWCFEHAVSVETARFYGLILPRLRR